MSVARAVFRALSPAGPKARLSVLLFHRVLPVPDPLFPDLPDASRFSEILRWIKAWFNVLPLDEAARLLAGGRLPERAAAITFDDGYADNARVALPLLAKAGLPATFFIATGYLDGGRMWNDTVIETIRAWHSPMLDGTALTLGMHPLTTNEDRRRAIDACIGQLKYWPVEQRTAQADALAQMGGITPPRNLMMASDDIRTLSRAGMQIGAHTVSHPILAGLTLAEARREIEGSKTQLEEILGERVSLFAYPNGKRGEDYQRCHALLVRDIGFDAAVATDPGVADAGTDLMELPRFTPWDRSRSRFGLRLLANLMQRRSAADAREDKAAAPI